MPSAKPLWNPAFRLVLASKSHARRALLEAAGLPFLVEDPDVDERALEQNFLARGGSGDRLPALLARAKALAVSRRHAGALCLGADQVLSLDGEILHKARSLAEAEHNLTRLAGRTHRLTSALAVAKDGEMRCEAEEGANLTMRALDPSQVSHYLRCAGIGALGSVGGYQIESLGIHLFERIEGEHAAILGLPMLKLLSYLRAEGALRL
jgi:septum formation protein